MEAALNGPSGRTTLGPAILTIGRLPSNALVVNDAKASSRHAEINPTGSGYSITDIGSTNGTFINEQRLDRNVPRVLNPGDRIRIGDTVFTYEGSGAYQQAPTVYANPGEGNSPAYPPTVAAPSSYTDYNVGQAYQAPQAYPPAQPGQEAWGASYQPPPAAYPSYIPPAQPAYGTPGYPVSPTAPKTNRKLLIWLGAGGAALLVVLLIVLFAVVLPSTPTKTLNNYCNAIKSGDYHTAYGQLSSSAQSQLSEAQFTSIEQGSIGPLNGVSGCVVSNVNQNGSTATGTITYTFGDGRSGPVPYTLVNESGGWKISKEG